MEWWDLKMDMDAPFLPYSHDEARTERFVSASQLHVLVLEGFLASVCIGCRIRRLVDVFLLSSVANDTSDSRIQPRENGLKM